MKGKAEEMEKMNKEAKEEDSKSGEREFEGEKGKVAVVCKRACYESYSGLNLEEEGWICWEMRVSIGVRGECVRVCLLLFPQCLICSRL